MGNARIFDRGFKFSWQWKMISLTPLQKNSSKKYEIFFFHEKNIIFMQNLML